MSTLRNLPRNTRGSRRLSLEILENIFLGMYEDARPSWSSRTPCYRGIRVKACALFFLQMTGVSHSQTSARYAVRLVWGTNKQSVTSQLG